MGWGRMFLLGNIGQQMDIDDIEGYLEQAMKAIEENANLDKKQASDIDQLKQENHELKLYLLALVRILISKGVVSQSEVESIISKIESPEK
jgi:hypothetical protein